MAWSPPSQPLASPPRLLHISVQLRRERLGPVGVLDLLIQGSSFSWSKLTLESKLLADFCGDWSLKPVTALSHGLSIDRLYENHQWCPYCQVDNWIRSLFRKFSLALQSFEASWKGEPRVPQGWQLSLWTLASCLCETEWKEPLEEEGARALVYKALALSGSAPPWFHGVCEKNGYSKSPKDLGTWAFRCFILGNWI